jgi:preprotein translocase subunit SecG
VRSEWASGRFEREALIDFSPAAAGLTPSQRFAPQIAPSPTRRHADAPTRRVATQRFARPAAALLRTSHFTTTPGRPIFPALMWLSILIPILLTILVIVCVLLVLVVLMQRPRSEGLGAAFGSGMTENIFGAQTTTVLTKATVYLGGIFFGITLILTILVSRQSSERRVGLLESELKNAKPAASATVAPKTGAMPGSTVNSSSTPAANVTPQSSATPQASVSAQTSATPISSATPEVTPTPVASPSAAVQEEAKPTATPGVQNSPVATPSGTP